MSINNPFYDVEITEKESLPEGITEIGAAGMITSQIPSLIGASQLSGAYKVVMPGGTAGELMRLKSGLLNTAVVNEKNTIIGQAGLQSLSGVASPMVVFSVASMITGQYFMSQINESLTNLEEGLTEIQGQIDFSEEAEVFSAFIFIQEMKTNWTLILESEKLQTVYLTTLLSNINTLTASCYYFENRLNSKMSELKKACDKNKPLKDKLFSEIKRNAEFLKFAYEIRSCLKIMFLYLSVGINKYNATEIKSALEKDEDLLFASTIAQLDKSIDDVIANLGQVKTIGITEQVNESKDIILGVRNITRDRYKNEVRLNVIKTIDNFARLDSEGQEFYIVDDKIYV